MAAQFAEVLRRSYWARGDSYEELVAEAEVVARELPEDSAVAELRDMIRRTRRLVDALPSDDDLALLVEEARRTRLLEAEAEVCANRTPELERLLEDLRRRNDELEARLQELIRERGGR